MSLIKNLFQEKCPTCNKVLVTAKSSVIKSLVIKSCPDDHYEKEYHPALETYIEHSKIS